MEDNMNINVTKILKLANNLTKPELLDLNRAIITLIKNLVDKEITNASYQFNKGDIVSFIGDNEIKRYGVIVKRNQKTFQVLTLDRYSINVPSTYLTHETKPSQKLVSFRKNLLLTNEDHLKALGSLFKNGERQNP